MPYSREKKGKSDATFPTVATLLNISDSARRYFIARSQSKDIIIHFSLYSQRVLHRTVDQASPMSTSTH
jgi:hypothetical protein